MSQEVWKPIPEFEGLYEVSDQGRVKRVAGGQGAVPGRILKGSRHYQGYIVIDLRDGLYRRNHFVVHRLVMLAFCGVCPDGYEVNHINGQKDDNRLVNLEYVTPLENTRHAIAILGRKGPQGEKHGDAKLTRNDVIMIRQLNLTFRSARLLADQYDVATNTIWKAYKHKTWRHIA